MNKKLHNTIMRRIYYVYAVRLIMMPGVLQGLLMFVSLIALTYFVSLGNVILNLLNIPVRDMGTFFFNAITNTEAWTLLFIGIFVYAALSFRFKISPPIHLKRSYANG